MMMTEEEWEKREEGYKKNCGDIVMEQMNSEGGEWGWESNVRGVCETRRCELTEPMVERREEKKTARRKVRLNHESTANFFIIIKAPNSQSQRCF